MRVIVAGSRTLGPEAYEVVERFFNHGWPFVERVDKIISGCAKGGDRLGERYAEIHGVALERHPALWLKYGRKAGFIRNLEMAESGDALIALWDGRSPGTKHMIDSAIKKGLWVKVFIIAPKSGISTPVNRFLEKLTTY